MSELDDMMTVLAINIVADGRVADEEIDVFKKAISRIKLSDSDINLPSEDTAVAWFKTYQDDIHAIVFGPRATFEDRLVTLLNRLATHIDPEALIHILQMISIADGEFHQNETRLINFIKRHWEMG